jgi:hypothetical protein
MLIDQTKLTLLGAGHLEPITMGVAAAYLSYLWVVHRPLCQTTTKFVSFSSVVSAAAGAV